jgi:hypothetical protein
MFESLSLILTGDLEAEREREQQHNEAEETHRCEDEQRDYRCDRVSYVTKWLLHLLSSFRIRGLAPPLASERLYERSAWPVSTEVAETRSRQAPRKHE